MCGLMDQMVISSGVTEKAMFFDTKNGNIDNVSLFKNHKFLKLVQSFLNSMKSKGDNL